MTAITRTSLAPHQTQLGEKTPIGEEQMMGENTGLVRDNLDNDSIDMEHSGADQSDNNNDNNYDDGDMRDDAFMKKDIDFVKNLCDVDLNLQKGVKNESTDNDDIMNNENHASIGISRLLESHL